VKYKGAIFDLDGNDLSRTKPDPQVFRPGA